MRLAIERFHMTSRRLHCYSKTMKRWPCWFPKPTLWQLQSFLMETLSFVPINVHRCSLRDRYWGRADQLLVNFLF